MLALSYLLKGTYKMKSIAFAVMMFMVGAVDANEYFDYATSNYVEITDGLVKEGEEVEYFDYKTGSYQYGEVTDTDAYGEVEVYEYSTGQYRYLEEQ